MFFNICVVVVSKSELQEQFRVGALIVHQVRVPAAT